MRTFAQAANIGVTTTENGAVAFKRTGSSLVDFFFKVAASRNIPELEVVRLYYHAAQEDLTLANKILFWSRDVRGGAGERRGFREILKYVASVEPEMAVRFVPHIPEYGRWDDLLEILDISTLNLDTAIMDFIREALYSGDALCAKWMPRQGPAAARLAKHMGLSPKQWRRLVVSNSNTVEQKLCAKDFSNIEYGHVPSVAAKLYQNTFQRHDPTGYEKYKQKLVSGEAKINASAIFPHDVVVGALKGQSDIANAQWKALPDYINGAAGILPMVDVSGSMDCRAGKSNVSCLNIAVSLGLYCSERLSGPFKDLFMTFSESPEFVRIKGATVVDRVKNMERAHWGMNTNIEAAFNRILEVAKKHKVPESEMPRTLLIMSDMQFDRCTRVKSTLFEYLEEEYKNAGYELPKVVFWNLNAYNNVPVAFDQRGVALVSGFSPSIMKSVLSSKNFTPYGIMLNTINDERYSVIGQ